MSVNVQEELILALTENEELERLCRLYRSVAVAAVVLAREEKWELHDATMTFQPAFDPVPPRRAIAEALLRTGWSGDFDSKIGDVRKP